MCGRFAQFRGIEALRHHFPVDIVNIEITPNYNVAPTQEIPCITRRNSQNHLVQFQWGLVPFWAKGPGTGNRLINARSESVATKPSFKNAFKKRRCLIPADGFYEWKGSKGAKQPMFLTLPDKRPFAFAGLWEVWHNKGDRETSLHSCALLTRQAGESVMPIHDRMPVILKPDAYHPWLDPDHQDIASLRDIINTGIHTALASYPVSKEVNAVKNNRPENILPIISS